MNTNKIIPHPQAKPAPRIVNRQQLEAVVENIVRLQLERRQMEQDQESEITAIRQKYRGPLAEVERYLTLETTWAETWAQENPGAFTEKRSLACAHATIGFRVTPPRVDRASRKWTWTAVAEALAQVPWGARYLRVPAPELNKEALLGDRTRLASADLKAVGLKIVQEERFYITPLGTGEMPLPAEQEEWREAA